MTSDALSNKKAEFQDALLCRLGKARLHSRLVADPMIEKVKQYGGVDVAKDELKNHDLSSQDRRLQHLRWSPYQDRMIRLGWLDLSIEDLVLKQEWQSLFSEEELERARCGLCGNADRKPPPSPGPDVYLPISELQHRRLRMVLWAEPPVQPDLARARDTLHVLLKQLKITLDLGDERIERLVVLAPYDVYDDFEDADEAYANDRESVLDSARPAVAWRAAKLAHFVGRYLRGYCDHLDCTVDDFLELRKSKSEDIESAWVQSLPQELYAAAALASKVFLSLDLAMEAELWLPGDGDLVAMPGILAVEYADCVYEWEEVIGKPPDCLNVQNLLYIAWRASTTESGRKQEEGISAEITLDAINHAKQEARVTREAAEESLHHTRALKDTMEAIRQSLTANDRYTAEEQLKAGFGEDWGYLGIEVRELLIGSEQVRLTRDFAAPSMIVAALTQAFEIHLKNGRMREIYNWLRKEGIWCVPADDRKSALFRKDWPTVRLQLRQMEELLQRKEVEGFFREFGFDLDQHVDALKEVREPRNDAHHGATWTFMKAEEIRNQLLAWRGLPGGVFGAIRSRR